MFLNLNPNKKEELYNKYLKNISGKVFTKRQIDVLACRVQLRNYSKIASILNINSIRTVEAHIRDIRKIIGNDKNSIESYVVPAEKMIDFVELSGKRKYLVEYYFYLRIQSIFREKLEKIKLITNAKEYYYYANFNSVKLEEKKELIFELQKDLSFVKINPITNSQLKKTQNIKPEVELCIFGSSNTQKIVYKQTKHIYIFCEKFKDLTFAKNIEYVELNDYGQYYYKIFELINKIIQNPTISKIKEEFEQDSKAFYESWGNIDLEIDKTKNNNGESLDDKSSDNSFLFYFKNILLAPKIKKYFYFALSVTILISSFIISNKLLNIQSLNAVKLTTDNQINWNIPYLIKIIAPYDKTIKKISKNLTNSYLTREKRNVVAICAPECGGKSAIASTIMNQLGKNYSFRGWFNADSEEIIKSEYIALGEKLNLFSHLMTFEQKIETVRAWIDNNGNSFVVYDDLKSIQFLKKILPQKGLIIITSQNCDFDKHKSLPTKFELDNVLNQTENVNTYFHSHLNEVNENIINSKVKLINMEDNHAFDLFNSFIPKDLLHGQNYEHSKNVYNLIKLLDYNLVSIALAGSYIAEQRISPEEYLKKYIINQRKIEQDTDFNIKKNPLSLATALSIKALEQLYYIDEIDLLNIAASFYNKDIPKKLLQQCLFDSDESSIKFNEVIKNLARYALIRTADNKISIHSQIHNLIKEQQNLEDKIVIYSRCIKALKNLYPFNINKTPEEINFIKTLYPHIEEMILNYKLLDNEKEYSDLLYIAGDINYELGNYDRSNKLFSKVLEINNNNGDIKNIELARILFNLGKNSLKIDDYNQAIKFFEDTLKIQHQILDENNLEIAYTLKKIGEAYIGLKKYYEAKTVINNAIKIEKKVLKIDDLRIAHSLHFLGKIYLNIGEYNKAKNYITSALKIYKKHFSENNVEISFLLYDLGKVYTNLAQYKNSKLAFEESLKIQTNILGKNHYYLSSILHKLGETHLNLGQYYEARGLLKKSLKYKKQNYTGNYKRIISIMNTLAECEIYLNNLDNAYFLLDSALNIESNYLDKNSKFSGILYHSLGKLYLQKGDLDKSEKYLDNSYSILNNYIGDSHIEIVKVMSTKARLYAEKEKYNEAENIFYQVNQIIKGSEQKNSIYEVKSYINLGNIYRINNKLDDSRKCLEKAKALLHHLDFLNSFIDERVNACIDLLYKDSLNKQ